MEQTTMTPVPAVKQAAQNAAKSLEAMNSTSESKSSPPLTTQAPTTQDLRGTKKRNIATKLFLVFEMINEPNVRIIQFDTKPEIDLYLTNTPGAKPLTIIRGKQKKIKFGVSFA